jgi:diguanylate cyclase (GGDEF)-like protein
MSKDAKIPTTYSSIRLDLLLLDRLTLIQRICLTVVTLIAGITLATWFYPPLSHLLPAAWIHMKANTCLIILCTVLSLILAQPKRGPRLLMVSRILAAFVFLVFLAVVLEASLHISFHLSNVLLNKDWFLQPQTGAGISLESACFLALLCLIVVLMRIRARFAAILADLLVLSVGMLVLIVGAGSLFGASRLSDLAAGVHVSPQTLLCLLLLAYVIVLRKAETGYFAILMGTGIGSKIARIACPFALLLPFLLDMGENSLVQKGWMSAPYATALSSSAAAMLGFALILILAWRIDALGKAIHDLSLRDELTQVYNRRGFYLLAEQSFYLTQRSKVPFSVLFLDLDDLKLINDTLGHDAGSSFLYEVAVLLKRSFRRSDVIGRVGGDEFVVAGEASEITILRAVERLKKATDEWNAQPGRKYRISYSYGLVTADASQEESLEELLNRADKAMYESKRNKKQMRIAYPDEPAAD